MKKTNDIYLKSSDMEKLLKREVGRGTDGKVIFLNKNILIKLYHHAQKRILEKIKERKLYEKNYLDGSNDDDIKIYEKGKKVFKPQKNSDSMRYYVKESNDSYIRLDHKEGLRKAISRQQDIIRSKLPQGMVYIDGKLAGCNLVPQNGIPIHKLTGILPVELKIKVLLDVLKSVKELTDHFIYPIDLDNSPFTKTAIYNNKAVGHSHVLVSFIPFKTNLIDLDGKSTVYTDFKSDYYEQQCYSSFKRLMDEFLFLLDYDCDYSNDDFEQLYAEKGVPREFIDKLMSDKMDYNDIKELLNHYTRKSQKVR